MSSLSSSSISVATIPRDWLTYLANSLSILSLAARQETDHCRPEHVLYKLVDLPFHYNTVAFFVTGLLAVNGLRDFRSWSEIYAISKPPDPNFVRLEYTNNVSDRHVFARYGKALREETRPATSLVKALADLGQCTGFVDKPTPGAIRREALLQVDRGSNSFRLPTICQSAPRARLLYQRANASC